MKTEKRLTMALSVLVALMMLAVPLASSSNLFVDGGQTNSNGDAPLLGDNLSPRVDFILNEGNDGRISLDKAKIGAETIAKSLNDAAETANLDDLIKFYDGEDGNVFAIVTNAGENYVTMQQLIYLLTTQGSNGAANSFSISKDGYTLDAFVSGENNSSYGPSEATNAPDKEDGDRITGDMTLTATWLLKDTFAEIPVDVYLDDELYGEYIKAYEKDETGKKVSVQIPNSFLKTGIDSIDVNGIVVNLLDNNDIVSKILPVYDFETTYGNNKIVDKDATDPITLTTTDKFTMNYKFNGDKYSKIVVSSDAFDKEVFKDGTVTLYADKLRSYSFVNIYNALTTVKSGDVSYELPILKLIYGSKNITQNGFKLTGWNEHVELLESENPASSPLTLDAELNGYYAIFMSKGQFEKVYVPFGELSASSTTLDISGVNHWVYIPYSVQESVPYYMQDAAFKSTDFKKLNFSSSSDVKSIEDLADKSKISETPSVVIIACFTPESTKSYAVFNANDGSFDTDGYVTKLIIPGKIGSKISTPSMTPIYDEETNKVIFIEWDDGIVEEEGGESGTPSEGGETTVSSTLGAAYSTDAEYAKTVTTYTATTESYIYKITFYNGSEVNGTLYYNNETTFLKDADFKYGAQDSPAAPPVAFEYNGKAYKYTSSLNEVAQTAYKNIFTPKEPGYAVKQWNDVDGNKVISNLKFVSEFTLKDDLNLYVEFKAKEYLIAYNGNTATATNNMPQIGTVDQAVNLFSDSAFSNDGYKLKEWNTRPDGNGQTYALGSSFTLSGEQYEELNSAPTGNGLPTDYEKGFTLYAIWESVGGSGSGSGGNTGGDDDNMNTYILIAILIVIIIMIIVVAYLLRNKN